MDDNNKTFESQSPHFSMKICGGDKTPDITFEFERVGGIP